MRIIFVRHAESDHAHDNLTDQGRSQAAAVAKRLAGEGITRIFAGPARRAGLTAYFTAKRLDLPLDMLFCLREIAWSVPGSSHDTPPWILGRRMLEEGFDFSSSDWQEHPYFDGNIVTECYRALADEFDTFLEEYGYRHEDRRFFCENGSAETIAAFSHGGSTEAILAHVLNLPFPYVMHVMQHEPASIIILEFPVNNGAYVFPRIELFNDCSCLLTK